MEDVALRIWIAKQRRDIIHISSTTDDQIGQAESLVRSICPLLLPIASTQSFPTKAHMGDMSIGKGSISCLIQD